MPKIPEGAKKPTDRQEKSTPDADPTMKFVRDGKTYVSLPMSKTLTADLILMQPDPEKCTNWEQMQFMVRMVMSAFRDDPEALEHVKTMGLEELGQMNNEVEDEAGVDLGE